MAISYWGYTCQKNYNPLNCWSKEPDASSAACVLKCLRVGGTGEDQQTHPFRAACEEAASAQRGRDGVSRPRPVSFLWLCLLALFQSSQREREGEREGGGKEEEIKKSENMRENENLEGRQRKKKKRECTVWKEQIFEGPLRKREFVQHTKEARGLGEWT